MARHGLGTEAARTLLEQALEHYAARFPQVGVERTWLGPNEARLILRGRGQSLAVAVHCDDQWVTAEADLPLVLRPFAGRIRARLDREVQSWLQRTTTPA